MLETRPPGIRFDAGQMKVVAFFVSVVVIRDPNDGVEDDVGGAGSIAIDNLNAYNVSSRATPTTFETIRPNLRAATAAVRWLATQQRGNGLLKSWEEEDACLAHTYDQALALIVFAHEHRWTEANRLVSALVAVQNTDGSWFQTHRCDTNPPEATTSSKWEGDIAWATYALSSLSCAGRNPSPGRRNS